MTPEMLYAYVSLSTQTAHSSSQCCSQVSNRIQSTCYAPTHESDTTNKKEYFSHLTFVRLSPLPTRNLDTYFTLTLRTKHDATHCHKHCYKRPTCYPLAQQANITSKIKDVSHSNYYRSLLSPMPSLLAYSPLHLYTVHGVSCSCNHTSIQPYLHPRYSRRMQHKQDQTSPSVIRDRRLSGQT